MASLILPGYRQRYFEKVSHGLKRGLFGNECDLSAVGAKISGHRQQQRSGACHDDTFALNGQA